MATKGLLVVLSMLIVVGSAFAAPFVSAHTLTGTVIGGSLQYGSGTVTENLQGYAGSTIIVFTGQGFTIQCQYGSGGSGNTCLVPAGNNTTTYQLYGNYVSADTPFTVTAAFTGQTIPVFPSVASFTHRTQPSLSPVEGAFGMDVDYAMLVKIYGASNDGESRYSPATCIGCRTGILSGTPDPNHISTSFVERQNLTMRMSMRRFTRLTNAFSKKIENHGHSVALHFMHYNFCRIHKTLKVTPAMEAGLTDHVWTLDELVGLLDNKAASVTA
jgi:hypothetical protein